MFSAKKHDFLRNVQDKRQKNLQTLEVNSNQMIVTRKKLCNYSMKTGYVLL